MDTYKCTPGHPFSDFYIIMPLNGVARIFDCIIIQYHHWLFHRIKADGQGGSVQ